MNAWGRMAHDLDRALHGEPQLSEQDLSQSPVGSWEGLLEETRILVKKHQNQSKTIRTLMGHVDELEHRLGEEYQS